MSASEIGILLGDNPRSLSFWDLMLEKFDKSCEVEGVLMFKREQTYFDSLGFVILTKLIFCLFKIPSKVAQRLEKPTGTFIKCLWRRQRSSSS